MHQTNLNGGLEAEADVLDVAKLTGLDLLVTNALLVLEDVALLLVRALVLLSGRRGSEGGQGCKRKTKVAKRVRTE